MCDGLFHCYHDHDKWQLGARNAYAFRAIGMFFWNKFLSLSLLTVFIRCHWIVMTHNHPLRVACKRDLGVVFWVFFGAFGTVIASVATSPPNIQNHHYHPTTIMILAPIHKNSRAPQPPLFATTTTSTRQRATTMMMARDATASRAIGIFFFLFFFFWWQQGSRCVWRVSSPGKSFYIYY